MRKAFIVLIAVGLLARIVIRLAYANLSNPELWEFNIISLNLALANIFSMGSINEPSAFMPPFYPLLIAGFYKVFGFGFPTYFALSVFLWAVEFAIPFVIGWLGVQIWNLRVGQFAFIMALFWPMLLLTSGRLLNVPVYTLLPFLSVAILFSNLQLWKRIVLIGLIMGLLWNNRFETPLFMLPFAYYLFFFDKDRITGQLPPLMTRFFAVTALAAIFTACMTPWVVRNIGIYGKPLLSTEGGFHLRRGHHDGATGSGRDPWPANQGTDMEIPPPEEVGGKARTPENELLTAVYHREQAIEWIKANPEKELRLIGIKLYYFLVTDFTHPAARSLLVWPISLAALILGFYYWLRTGLRDPRQQVLWMLFGIQLLLCIAFIVLPRYRIAVESVPLLFFAAWICNTRFGESLCMYAATGQVRTGV